MYWTFVAGAVRLRLRRLLLAFAALAIASALSTVLFSVYSDIERRISAEFASYGANLVVAPAGSAVTVPLHAVEEARKLGAVAAPFLFTKTKWQGRPVTLAGVDLSAAKELTQFWHVEGTRTGCLAGVSAAESLHLKIGDPLVLGAASCTVSGTVSTGGSEDNEIVVPFPIASAIAGLQEQASLVQVRAPAKQLPHIQSRLRDLLPGSDVRLVRAVAETESGVVMKLRVVLFLLFALILVTMALSISSNFSELVLERSREIGILKAIGAAERRIAALFVSESLLLALFSTLAGYAVGIVLAGWIAARVFSAPFAIRLDLPVLLIAALITLAVALAATAFAAGRIWRIQPAVILRGE